MMLSENDYNHIKLLYDQFFKMNRYIKALIEKNDWDSVAVAIGDKEVLINKIIAFEKPRINDIKENQQLNKTRLELIDAEKDNLNLVKSMKEGLFDEIRNVKKRKKILNAYEPSSNNLKSTFVIEDDE